MRLANWTEIRRLDEIARFNTAVHRLDPRAKTIVTFAFVVAVMSFPRYTLSGLTPFILYPVALTSIGRIPLRFILKKILVAAPFAVAVALFNPVIDRQPVCYVSGIMITGGWISFASIILRFLLTVSAALSLLACTGMNNLAAALNRLGVPRAFVVQLMFLHRYIFVVSEQAVKMARSAALRSNGRPLRFSTYVSIIGHMLLRSMDRADRVYRAMMARGFDGNVRVIHQFHLRLADVAFVCCMLSLFVSARLWNFAAMIGTLAITGGKGS